MALHRCIVGLAVLMLFAAVSGCDTMVQSEEEPPELIPPQAFTVQAELFNQRRSGDATIDPHFMAAVMRVWPVSTMLESHLHLPARLTQAALDKTPTIQDGAWVWAATTSVDGEPLSFTLTGQPMGSEVDWTLKIVKTAPRTTTSASVAPSGEAADTSAADEDPFGGENTPDSPTTPAPTAPDSSAADSTADSVSPADSASPTPATDDLRTNLQALTKADSAFVLYTAQTATDGTEGRWRLYDTVDDERTNVLNGTFQIEKTNKIQLSLDVPPSASEHGGDSIVYAQDEDERRLRWTRAREGQTHRITWDVQSHQGSITATNYNDGQSACWGKQLDNVTCSE